MINSHFGNFLKYPVLLLGTLAIIVLIPNTIIVTVLLFLFWYITFSKLTRLEWMVFIVTSIAYTINDVMVIQQGIFEFRDQDVLLMPYYEIFMWGFYFLLTMRVLNFRNTIIPNNIVPGLFFSFLIMGILGAVSEVDYALLGTAVVLMIALIMFRTREDFLAVTCVLSIGLVVEFTGTYFGIWTYNIEQYLVWWVVTWAISGLVLYRAVLPVCAKIENKFFTVIDKKG